MTTNPSLTPTTFTACVCETGDMRGHWLYSGAQSSESAARHAIERSLRHGYALGESTVTVYLGACATPVGSEVVGEYRVTTRRGKIITFESTMAEKPCEIFI